MAGLGKQGLRMLRSALDEAEEGGLLDSPFEVGGRVTTYSPPKLRETPKSKSKEVFKKPVRVKETPLK